MKYQRQQILIGSLVLLVLVVLSLSPAASVSVTLKSLAAPYSNWVYLLPILTCVGTLFMMFSKPALNWPMLFRIGVSALISVVGIFGCFLILNSSTGKIVVDRGVPKSEIERLSGVPVAIELQGEKQIVRFLNPEQNQKRFDLIFENPRNQ
jgi:hypothetical protein